MKKFLSDPKPFFTCLVIASVLAIAGGVYLGVTLGMASWSWTILPAAGGILLWALAWGEFMALCLRLRGGETAFTQATGRTLRIIGGCMAALALITLALAVYDAFRFDPLSTLTLAIPALLLFGGAAVVARILRGLLEHAMSLEEEQEGVV